MFFFYFWKVHRMSFYINDTMPIPNGKSFSYQEQYPVDQARNARCIATGDPPFFINSSAIKARCVPDHAMVYTENGTYTAVRRRAPHHCTRSLPEAMPLRNRRVLSAAPCTIVCFKITRSRTTT
jgi:hypothetical protein